MSGPVVQCDCHPGVSWTTSTWGKECPLSRSERHNRALRECLARCLAAREGYAIEHTDGTLNGDAVLCEDIRDTLARTKEASGE